MASYCKRCSLHIPDGVSTCRMCGSSVLAAPPPPDTSGALFRTKPLPQPGSGFTKWLVLIAIGLVVVPLLRVITIVSRDLPLLFTDEGQASLTRYPGANGVLMFELFMNVALVLLALGLNYLFYARSRRFPHFMVAYAVSTFVLRIADTAAIHFTFPAADTERYFVPLVRTMLWVGAVTVYLLTAPEVKTRFDR